MRWVRNVLFNARRIARCSQSGCRTVPCICKPRRNFGPFKIYKCLAHSFHGTHQRHNSTPTLASKNLVKIEPVAQLFQQKGSRTSKAAPPILSKQCPYGRVKCQGQPMSIYILEIPKMSTQKAVAECLCQR